LVIAGLSSPVLADAVLPIGGAFGNEIGCNFFMTGQIENDEVLLVTPDTFTTYASGCYFESLRSKEDRVYELDASCTSEGEEGSTDETIVVTDRGPNGVFVELEGVAEWGPLFMCPGTEELFKGPGTQI
jgi:hypothetical protein